MEPQTLKIVIERARATAERMKEASAGQDETIKASMPMRVFIDISTMLSVLSDEVAILDKRPQREFRALERIANLDIRGASLLLEMQSWKRIAGELQAIAQDAIGLPKKAAVWTEPKPDDDRGPTGLGY